METKEKKKVSIEYCHIYPGMNEEQEIRNANEWMPRLVKMFTDSEVQACIMIDDIHSARDVDQEYLEDLVDQLTVKPDCIYLESEFIHEANTTLERIDVDQREFISKDERTWIREYVKEFKTTNEFLVYWREKNGDIKFSCPMLAATSYLVRLGAIQTDGVSPVWGAPLMRADYAMNLLDSQYVIVEDKAQSIIDAVDKTALRKIGWFFF